MGAQFSQFFPLNPTFTEKDLPQTQDKIFLITGGTSGIGLELAKILYRHGGSRVYITGRTEEKVRAAIREIRAAVPNLTQKGNGNGNGNGRLDYIVLELSDLASIKAPTEQFMTRESRLDVLFNNAGVSQPPVGSKSKQGYEFQIAMNILGPFLFTRLLLPLLETTASTTAATNSSSPPRVIWTNSQVAELSSPAEVIILSELTTPLTDPVRNYLNSKTGNMFLSAEFVRRNLFRTAKVMKLSAYSLLHSPKQAAHTVLYAGLSEDISVMNSGCYITEYFNPREPNT
ncbi:uncharacterized protein BDV14DRAFT_189274 [Aspergillus stella-maris]|uniref:uncharacterized protein n=1 Tax=Aspergillus stella-maris TaxID=1810926 RepID=UPI003CCD6D1A